MAARSTHVTLENRAGEINLRRTSDGLDHGIWTIQPPQLIGNLGEWESESNGFLTGTEGRVTYQLESIDGVRIGELNLHWDNPFVRSNSYDESVAPAAASASSNGFSVVHIGGGGDNASVRFVLLNRFCKANEAGEISCSTASPLTVATETFAAIWEQTSGPSWHAVHDLTSDQYQQIFNQLVGQGLRPVKVDGYLAGGQDRYAAIFEQRDGPPFQARHGLTSDQYQQTFNELVGQGFRPISVSGYSVAGQDRYAAIFEQRGGPVFQARHGLTSDQYQQTFNDLVGQGFRPIVVSGYSVGGQDRYAAVFEQSSGPPFQARHGLTSDQYQQTFNDLVGQGFRPILVSGYSVGGQDRYAAVFEQRGGPVFQARHGLTSDQYQQTFNDLVGQGFRLIDVSGHSLE